MKRKYLKFYFIRPKQGIRSYIAKVTTEKVSKNKVYEQNGFFLFVNNDDDLCIKMHKNSTPRKIRRFLRDFAKSEKAIPRTLSHWMSDFK